MPEGPWHFPEDQVSDATERALAAEVTREQLYLQLHAELPYASAVETEKFDERDDGSVEIHQQILVERPTQRAIVLGKGGARIKEIGARARARAGAICSTARSTCTSTSRSSPAGTRTATSIATSGWTGWMIRAASRRIAHRPDRPQHRSTHAGTSSPAGPQPALVEPARCPPTARG